MAARQVVKHHWILRFEPGQPFVHFQAEIEPAARGVMVAQELKRLDVARITTDETFHEGDLDVQFARFLAANFPVLKMTLLRHTTLRSISKSRLSVKCEIRISKPEIRGKSEGRMPNPESGPQPGNTQSFFAVILPPLRFCTPKVF